MRRGKLAVTEKRFILFTSIALGICILIALNHRATTLSLPQAWGNSSNNIIENGIIAGTESNIFISDVNGDRDALIKVSIDGTSTTLVDYWSYNINVVGDRVYFIRGKPGKICSVDTNGRHLRTLVRKPCDNLIVGSENMAYRCGGSLYIADTKGNRETCIAEYVSRFAMYDDGIIYITYGNDSYGDDDPGLYIWQPASGEAIPVYLGDVGEFFQTGDRLFFTVSSDRMLHCCDLTDNSLSQFPLSLECWDLNGNDEYIFFRNQSYKGELWRLTLETMKLTPLVSDNCTNIQVFGDNVVFRVPVGIGTLGSGYYIMNSDGTDIRPLEASSVWKTQDSGIAPSS